MRPRFVAVILILMLAALVAIFWLRPGQQHAPVQIPAESLTGFSNAPTSEAQNVATPQPRVNPIVTGTAALSSSDPQKRQDDFRQTIENKNTPITFYGQVIDQDSNGVPAAQVKTVVREWYVFPPETLNAEAKEIHLDQMTDASGRFQIIGMSGDSVFLESIIKDGYELEPGQHNYGPTGSSLENPLVFKMWQINIHEQMITGEKKFKIVPDGRWYFIDLENGSISESASGDLKVWIKRPDPIAEGSKYAWSSGIEAIGGGLSQELDPNSSMYIAPTENYLPSFSYDEAATSDGWGDTTGAERFYVKLNGGQNYGRISIELEAYYNNQTPAMIRIQYAVNTTGSRILR